MADLAKTWKATKSTWTKKGQKAVPDPIISQMKEKGWDKGGLSKKLTAVDKAKNDVALAKAWSSAQKVITEYKEALGEARKWKGLDRAAYKALAAVADCLNDLDTQGRALVLEPPVKPSGRSETVRLVSRRNAASGLRPEWLEVGTLDISAYVVVDAEVVRLEKEGQLGFHWVNVQSDVNKVIDRTVDDFVATIKSVDATLLETAPDKRDEKVREANEALRHYANIVERQVNDIVDDYWARASKRQAYLKSFKQEIKVEFAMSAVAIAVAGVSLAFTLGAAAPAWLSVAKSVVEIGFTLEKLERSASTVRAGLEKRRKTIVKELDSASAGRATSKARQHAKEAIASALGGISTKLMTTTTRTAKETEEYLGKLTAMETKAAVLLGQLDDFTASFPSAPKGPDARSSREINGIYNNFKAMHARAVEFQLALRKDIDWAEHLLALCNKLNDVNTVATIQGVSYHLERTKQSGTLAKAGLALTAVVLLTEKASALLV